MYGNMSQLKSPCEVQMTAIKLKKRYTVGDAKKILRIAQSSCVHRKVTFCRGRQPSDLEDAEKSNAWGYTAQCNKCLSYASGTCDAPVCLKCSTVKKLAVMRLVTTKEDPSSRWGKIFVYTCDSCKQGEEFTFPSSYH